MNIKAFIIIGITLGFLVISVFSFITLQEAGISFSLSALVNLHIHNSAFWGVDLLAILYFLLLFFYSQQKSRLIKIQNQLRTHEKLRNTEIQNQSHFFQALIENTPIAVVQLDSDHKIISLNPAFEQLFEYKENEVLGKMLDEFIVSECNAEKARNITSQVINGALVKSMGQRRRKSGTLVDVDIIGIPVMVSGENIGALGIYYDITSQKEAEQALFESETRFRSLFEDSPISLWEMDLSPVKNVLDTSPQKEPLTPEETENEVDALLHAFSSLDVLNLNQATLDLLGISSKEVLIRMLPDIFSENILRKLINNNYSIFFNQPPYKFDLELITLLGEKIYTSVNISFPPGSEKSWNKAFISMVNITDRKDAEDKLRYISFHDPLTGLYNRAYFEEELKKLESSRRYPVSIIICDLDDLKAINDNFGHEVGDKALRGVGRILMEAFRADDVVSRIGGDEFAAILPSSSTQTPEVIVNRIENIIKSYNQTVSNDEYYRPISLSIGYASVPLGESLRNGFMNADKYMYGEKAKKKRFNR